MDKIVAALFIALGFVVAFVFFSLLLAWPVMMLWNGCLVGAVAGVSNITWLQSWGLMVLCSFLFKSTSTSKS